MGEYDHWLGLARWTPLAILADLDGTLVPFSPTPEDERPAPALLALLNELARAPGVTVAVVSGRSRESLETMFSCCEQLLLIAEQGAWRRDVGAWQPALDASQEEVEELHTELRRLARDHPGACVERKTWAVTFDLGALPPEARDGAAVELETRIQDWLAAHPRFTPLRREEALEVRPARMDKGNAVAWLRERSHARLLVIGDDVTDEDMFRSLAAGDESVLVSSDGRRPTSATWRLDAPDDVARFLHWIHSVRHGESASPSPSLPRRIETLPAALGAAPYRLLVISNRLPELRSAAEPTESRRRNVGGLVSALEPVLASRHGIWLGWSGRTEPRADPTRFELDSTAEPALAGVDLTEEMHKDYYNGLCNGALWPLLHSFVARAEFLDQEWEAYRAANDAFASAAARLVGPSDTVWAHDYHLFLLAQRLRDRGHHGPIGLFLHVPFPAPDIFFLFPWAEELLVALLSFDLVGFHTSGYVTNFRQCLAMLPGTLVGDDAIEYRGRRTRVGAFPIGIIPEHFQEPPASSTVHEVTNLMRAIAPTRLVLGVDRLDYTKGIPERLTAFRRLLEIHPEWRRKVSLVQISVPSRADVPAYVEQRQRVEAIVGRANGELGDADWVPIRYLYRSYARNQLSQLYRASAIGYVTPLRDGMNLVAKEWVAAQDPADPGVLVLSRFAGAAAELTDALLTNPWHVDGLARDLDHALRMSPDERRARHQKLLAAVSRTTALSWAEDFLFVLAASGAQRNGAGSR